ncbi:MAG: HipA N-terminal domain-containing protein [Geobacteraceae bacterium]|nr:HipA N-terminal domain-containing protein [Geobacteraceae bacterium]
MNGRKVGQLTRTSSGKLRFSYGEVWLDWELRRPLSLSMPLTQEPYTGDLVDNYFDNLLPDSQTIRNRIQARFSARSNRCFDLLWHVGRDCVGALQLFPEDIGAVDVRRVESAPLGESEIAETLRNYKPCPLAWAGIVIFAFLLPGHRKRPHFCGSTTDGVDRWALPRPAIFLSSP